MRGKERFRGSPWGDLPTAAVASYGFSASIPGPDRNPVPIR
jgi:hypothetical protein